MSDPNSRENFSAQVIKIKKIDKRAQIPLYKTSGSAGFDLSIILDRNSEILPVGATKLFSTGLAFIIPEGYEVQIRSRSGMALKGIVVTNQPATVDSDYHKEIKIMLTNLGQNPFTLNTMDRVAQGVMAKVTQASFVEVESVGVSDRGGFGSTGINDFLEAQGC